MEIVPVELTPSKSTKPLNKIVLFSSETECYFTIWIDGKTLSLTINRCGIRTTIKPSVDGMYVVAWRFQSMGEEWNHSKLSIMGDGGEQVDLYTSLKEMNTLINILSDSEYSRVFYFTRPSETDENGDKIIYQPSYPKR